MREDVGFCPVCRERGLKSMVYPQGGSVTLMNCPSFYDEDGKYHAHDSNTHSAAYTCSLGHAWERNFSGECWCGWKGRPWKESLVIFKSD